MTDTQLELLVTLAAVVKYDCIRRENLSSAALINEICERVIKEKEKEEWIAL